MHVQIFKSEKGGFALAEDETGACLPTDRGPWAKVGSIDLIGPETAEACAAISHDGYFLTDTLPGAEGGEGKIEV